jgi:hypothetical protein
MNGLEVINAIHAAIYSARTTLNVGADTQEKHASELERALPPPAPGGEDWDGRATFLKAEKETAEATERAAIGQLRQEFDAGKEAATEECRAKEKEIDGDIDARVKALERERADRKKSATERRDVKIEALRNIANQEAAKIKAEHGPKVEALTAELATAQERARAQHQAEGTRKAIEVARQEAATKRGRSELLTASLNRLTKLKLDLAARVSIGGAYSEDGRIVREQDGGLVPLKRWNEADQWTFALRIGMKIVGGFVCIDGIQAFDGPHRKALIATAKKYAQEKGVQFILTAVDPEAGPLRISDAAIA